MLSASERYFPESPWPERGTVKVPLQEGENHLRSHRLAVQTSVLIQLHTLEAVDVRRRPPATQLCLGVSRCEAKLTKSANRDLEHVKARGASNFNTIWKYRGSVDGRVSNESLVTSG